MEATVLLGFELVLRPLIFGPLYFFFKNVSNPIEWASADQKIIGNSFQPIGGFLSGSCIHQDFRRKVSVDVIGQIGNIQFPRIL